MAQLQRFECKYLIPRSTAEDLRALLLQNLVMDTYCRNHVGQCYTISSLYLDNPRMSLYRGTVEGLKNRYKLRLRIYDEERDSPVFFEIKGRIDGIIRKKRAAVRKEWFPALLHGEAPLSQSLLKHSETSMANLLEFQRCMLATGASPLCLVRYKRQAFVMPGDESLRVTFDWDLDGREAMNGDLTLNGSGWKPADFGVDYDAIILEIKFTNTFPSWLTEIVCCFHLKRISVPKYVLCVDALELAESRVPSGGRLYQ